MIGDPLGALAVLGPVVDDPETETTEERRP